MPKYRNCNLTIALEIPQQAALLLTSDPCDYQAVERGRTLQLLHELHIRWHPENMTRIIRITESFDVTQFTVRLQNNILVIIFIIMVTSNKTSFAIPN